jgi:formylglycine-generating enzyme required for sulfatase activity
MDGGVSYAPTNYVTGDVGMIVLAGLGKHIEWNLGAEFGAVFSDQTKIRITATGRFIQVPFEFVVVPAGSFNYSVTGQPVNIPYDFEIMKYEVTNAEYTEYLLQAIDAGDVYLNGNEIRTFYPGDDHVGAGDKRCLDLNNSRISWNGTTFIVQEGYGNHPVTGVSWFGAWAFASYYGLRLPTDQEWEKTARGINNWTYPNGVNPPDSASVNFWNSGDPFDNGTTPVGYYDGTNQNGYQTVDAPSDYGAYDMAGNVVEWVNDWAEWTEVDRIIRGGSWRWDIWSMSFTWRSSSWSENDDNILGFRCVRTISPARSQWLQEKQRRSRLK